MTTETASRYATGGFEDRFRVTRTDAKAINPDARYLVLNYAQDPHAKAAIATYADSIEGENPAMAADLRRALTNPEEFPSQHD
jgi:hypothetical protein